MRRETSIETDPQPCFFRAAGFKLAVMGFCNPVRNRQPEAGAACSPLVRADSAGLEAFKRGRIKPGAAIEHRDLRPGARSDDNLSASGGFAQSVVHQSSQGAGERFLKTTDSHRPRIFIGKRFPVMDGAGRKIGDNTLAQCIEINRILAAWIIGSGEQ